MKLIQTVAPALYPVTLQEVKDQCKVDSTSLSASLTPYTSLAAGSHIVTTGYTHYGTAVDVLGYEAVVYLRPINNGAGGTVDTIIEDSDDGSTWATWGSAFTRVTESNDTVIQEIEYTGAKQYIRTASMVLVAACEFGTDVIRRGAAAADETLIEMCRMSAIDYVENFTNRQLLTATWKMYLNEFPSVDYIELPYGNLQSVTSVKYKDSEGTETTLTVTTDYLVETNVDATKGGLERGRIVLPYDGSWPTATLYPSNPITIAFVCGWTAAAYVPYLIKAAILLLAADFYKFKEVHFDKQLYENQTADRCLVNYRLREY